MILDKVCVWCDSGAAVYPAGWLAILAIPAILYPAGQRLSRLYPSYIPAISRPAPSLLASDLPESWRDPSIAASRGIPRLLMKLSAALHLPMYAAQVAQAITPP